MPSLSAPAIKWDGLASQTTPFTELPHVTLRRDYVLHISPDIVSTFVGHYRIDWLLGASAL